MLTRRLKALGYHHPDSFNINNESEVRNLIVWLEDKKIRHYDVSEREPLRDVESKFWIGALKLYLKDLNCPVENLGHKLSVITWLLGHALQLEYLENANTYNTLGEDVSGSKQFLECNQFLNSLAQDNSEFKKGVEVLRKTLRIPYHPNSVVILQAISKLVEERLNIEKPNPSKGAKNSGLTEYLSLKDTSLGFETGDNGVNEAAKIIRILQIRNLRELQTYINQAIVTIQRFSANPKTDQSLGRVGR